MVDENNFELASKLAKSLVTSLFFTHERMSTGNVYFLFDSTYIRLIKEMILFRVPTSREYPISGEYLNIENFVDQTNDALGFVPTNVGIENVLRKKGLVAVLEDNEILAAPPEYKPNLWIKF